jgi:hypothetical protein
MMHTRSFGGAGASAAYAAAANAEPAAVFMKVLRVIIAMLLVVLVLVIVIVIDMSITISSPILNTVNTHPFFNKTQLAVASASTRVLDFPRRNTRQKNAALKGAGS